MSDAAKSYVSSLQTYDLINNRDPRLSDDQSIEVKAAPNTAPIWQKQSYMDEPDNINKYKTIRDVKAKSRNLELQVSKYMEKFRLYSQYMDERGGEWNDFVGQNDMSGLGSTPNNDNEAAGWFLLGETDTLDECKRAALLDDKLYTRVVHYDDSNSTGAWHNHCFASVIRSKTSAHPTGKRGVTTSNRTYWIDISNSLILDPPNTVTAGQNYDGHYSLGKISTSADAVYDAEAVARAAAFSDGDFYADDVFDAESEFDPAFDNPKVADHDQGGATRPPAESIISDQSVPTDDMVGLYRCKERAKNPMITGMFSEHQNKEFVSVTYFGNSYAKEEWRGYCYAGEKDAKADAVPASGVWSSRQTKCLSDDEKAKLVRDLQDLYEDILRRKAVIDERLSVILPLKAQFGKMLNAHVHKIQFELQPKVNAYNAALKNEEAAISMLDNVDSHVQMNSYRYKYVLYVTFVVALIAGIYYILTSKNDNTYVTYAFFGIFISLVAVHIRITGRSIDINY